MPQPAAPDPIPSHATLKPTRWLVLVLLFAAGLRGLQASRLGCLSQDGVTYVEFAKKLATEPLHAMREIAMQPGYPALLLATHRLAGHRLSGDGVLAWERCGQLIAVLGGLAVVPLVYWLTARLFDQRTGLAAAALAALWPHAIELSADVLNDMPHLALELAATCLIASALPRLGTGRLIAVGTISGLAYLLRQEALAVPLAAAACCLVTPGPRRAKARLVSIAAVFVPFAIVVSPYVIATGELMHKKSIKELIEGGHREQLNRSASPALAGPVTSFTAPLHAADAWGKSGQYVFSTLALIGFFSRRVPRADRSLRRLLAILIALHVSAVLLRGRSFGVISTRYLVPVVALTLPWSAAGLLALSSWVRTQPSRVRRVALVAAIAPSVLLLAPLRHGPNAGKLCLRAAGLWLRAHSRPADLVLSPLKLAPLLYYADRAQFWPPLAEPAQMCSAAQAARPAWLVYIRRSAAASNETLFLNRLVPDLDRRPPAFEIATDAEAPLRIIALSAAPPAPLANPPTTK